MARTIRMLGLAALLLASAGPAWADTAGVLSEPEQGASRDAPSNILAHAARAPVRSAARSGLSNGLLGLGDE